MDVFEATADRDIDDAAQVWAEATTARDGHTEVPGLEISRPIIEQVLNRSPSSRLLIARSGDGVAMGFAVTEPHRGDDRSLAELRYLGVRPSAWRQRVGETLLREAEAVLHSAGFTRAVLSVYTDNRRAIALYARLGWMPCGQPQPHPRTGKPEQRYELLLGR